MMAYRTASIYIGNTVTYYNPFIKIGQWLCLKKNRPLENDRFMI
ncbi:hypothetical protein KIS4809_5051 [Bacillus sp. ZZV12-4809]|nr:hypothetical protein KIS4809_5051 [Bacillus sp. ZZV12-4809]